MSVTWIIVIALAVLILIVGVALYVRHERRRTELTLKELDDIMARTRARNVISSDSPSGTASSPITYEPPKIRPPF